MVKMVGTLEAVRKRLYYELVDPEYPPHIEIASLQEREGFGTGIDPQELPEVIRFLAEKGYVWLQYVDEGEVTPTGVMELVPLIEALKLDPNKIETEFDINKSPLVVITRNHEKAFHDARRFADGNDDKILYHHGIAMSRRGKGYGTLLLEHALAATPDATNRFIPCYIDAARVDEDGSLKVAANESSYTLHMKAGFVLVGVVNQPVYDDSVTYYSILRSPESRPFRYGTEKRKLKFDSPNVAGTINDVRELVSGNFVGVAYDKKSHEMTFAKLR